MTPFLALAIAGFCVLGAALFWVSIWSNLEPRPKSARAQSRAPSSKARDLGGPSAAVGR